MAALKNLDEISHLLKHFILEHEKDMKIEEMEYGMRVRNCHKTAF